ncbi:hypothetical protein LQT97_21630 [Brucella pseudogrignonensis]|uniref:hypothetical protein n=1 Tax=Brucella pseudogrignonensis TaxID=419475 RepID=UPI001E65ACC1|nr:hypothetical protein [Brucella pseudogrignonensis]MCD4513835.1 hypothetical protein [Brucella pseudogrignonensis]
MEVNQIHSVLSLVEVNAGLAVLPVYAFMPCTVAALWDAHSQNRRSYAKYA